MMDDLIGRHVIVTGRVQGVGFRAFTQYAATNLDVTGWVRNVGYDQVEIVAEAPANVMEAFLAEVGRGPRYSRVESVKIEELPFTGKFSFFEVTG